MQLIILFVNNTCSAASQATMPRKHAFAVHLETDHQPVSSYEQYSNYLE